MVAPIDEKIGESCLRFFDHVQRRAINAQVRKSELIQVEGMKKGRGRPKIALIELVKKDMSIMKITKGMILDRIE
jgi:hypothetical protein